MAISISIELLRHFTTRRSPEAHGTLELFCTPCGGWVFDFEKDEDLFRLGRKVIAHALECDKMSDYGL